MSRRVAFLIAWALFVITAVACVITAKPAEADPIFPRMIEGRYALAVITAHVDVDENGVPMSPPTRSVGIVRVDVVEPFLLVCEDVPGGLGERVSVLVDVPATGDRAELRAVAFNSAACTGHESDRSPNAAYVFFVPPGIPLLESEP